MMKFSVVLVSLCSIAATLSFGQIRIAPAEPAATGAPGPRPTKGVLLEVDQDRLREVLAGAPTERFDMHLREYGAIVTLIDPDGREVRCLAAESPMLEPALAVRHPEIRSFKVITEDLRASGRIEITRRGMTGMLIEADHSSGGAWMLDLWQARDARHVISYRLRDLPGEWDFRCETEADVVPHEDPGYQDRALQLRRDYRIAIATTGEYGRYHCDLQGNPPNTTDPLNAIVTVLSRTNVIYEADLGIHFNLVANNESIIFTDAETDPYNATCGGTGGSDCSGTVLGANAGVLNGAIGSANYDIGHCLTRVFGGVAYLRAVCGNNKAGGVSGMPRGGDYDPFAALVVIHEIGHQFGANHTFSGTRGRCAGNVNLNTAWEAGSGSSPMAYAGGCPVGDAPPSDNVVQFADPFFHHGSLIEMRNFLNGNGGNCDQVTQTTNEIPTIITIQTAELIPPSTPFELTAIALDPDVDDVLTYSWEQFDSGFARPLVGDGAFDNGQGALFRIFPPVESGTRSFPRMADVLSGAPTPGEMLPTVADAVRRFRCVVRDRNPQAGASEISSFVNVTVAQGTTRFFVTSPTAGAHVTPGAANVTWETGNTQNAPINAAEVSIDLSTDNGATFEHQLGTFPNTGSASVTIPAVDTASARIRIYASGKIFFAVSRPFHASPYCPSDTNRDGAVDGDDIIAYFSLWDAANADADLNQDGGVDGDDIIEFFSDWDAGC